MATAAQRHRTARNRLRDALQRAERDLKLKRPGAAARVSAHRARREAYAKAHA